MARGRLQPRRAAASQRQHVSRARAEADPDDVRPARVDAGGRLAPLRLGERPERRNLPAGDEEPREERLEALLQAARGLLVGAAVEIVAQARGAAAVERLKHRVGAVAAVHAEAREAAADEDDACSGVPPMRGMPSALRAPSANGGRMMTMAAQAQTITKITSTATQAPAWERRASEFLALLDMGKG